MVAMCLTGCCLVLRSFSNDSSQSGIVQNEHILAKINLCPTDSLFGSVISFKDKTIDGGDAAHGWFYLHAGVLSASQKRIVKITGDTIAVALSGFGDRSLHAEITYYLKDNSLQVASRLFVDSPEEFSDGLSFDFGTSFPNISAITPTFTAKALNPSLAGMNYSDLNPMVCFHDPTHAITALIRNPFHAFWTFDAGGKGNHRIEILKRLLPANGWGFNLGEKPEIGSTIGAGDTIFRHVEIYNNEPVGDLFFWGEHKNGWSQCITMYWDELPGSSPGYIWRFMTTADADDIEVDNYLVRLLEAHPKVKMGYLLLPDRILYRECASFNGWNYCSLYSIPDSLDEYAGTWCANVIGIDTGTQGLVQKISCPPNQRYAFSCWVKTEAIEPYRIGSGVYGGIIVDPSHYCTGELVTGTHEWQRYGFPFVTGPKDSSLSIFLGMEKTKGNAWFDEVQLLDSAGVNLVQNGGFEYNTPQILYDNKRRHWVDAHGKAHITDAPEPYRRFLQRIENGTLTYGWEDRVRLGCHGYHHTPSLDKPDVPLPGWEFQNYDPIGDQLRIEKIITDVQAVGLTHKSLRFWRSPGFKYTKSLVELLIDSGFVFMDPGNTTGNGNARCWFVERSGKRMWLPELTYWADYDSTNTVKKISEYLQDGHLGNMGGHPCGIFKSHTDDSYYKKFNNIITSFETAYPNLGYVFPDEYSDNANAVYNLKFGSVKQSGDDFSIEILGETTRGNTLIVNGQCLSALWNGETELEIKKNGDLSYIILPDSKQLRNTLVLKPYSMEKYRFPLFSAGRVNINGGETSFSTSLYSMAGRRIATFRSRSATVRGNSQMDNTLKKIPKGVYLYSVENGKKRIFSRLIRNFN
jgi:hypothetical protein